MFQTAGYPGHPPYFASYDHQTPPRTPHATDDRAYYSPRQYVFTSTPSPKGHTRRATGDAAYAYTTTYTTPRKASPPQYTTKPEYTTPGHYAPPQAAPQRRSDYVSDSHHREGTRYHHRREPRKSNSTSKHYSASRSRYVYDGHGDHEAEYLPRYERHETRPPPYKRHPSHYEARADHRYYDQVPVFTPADPAAQRPRPRRSSYTTPGKPTHDPRPPPRPRTAHKPPAQATADDAARAGIPAGYSYKNWDPAEEPILLLGSVFDANSLGKWIYDWTVFARGPGTPLADVAGELWLLLIQLAGKIKRAEDTRARIRQVGRRELVDEFLDSGERLWQRFNKVLKLCETCMWRAAKRESGGGGAGGRKVTMGKNSGCEFVDAMFGRDRELERTEQLMTGMRLWSMRFDANCEAILVNPGA
ncbi:hypothetical protein LTR53_009072 [Teratosphaeriaceae sp. CCFEE 6253]|nr:hypothetical protein LTR53_009072 [Teratosphaeriaceae sp. CCFEE 6253]